MMSSDAVLTPTAETATPSSIYEREKHRLPKPSTYETLGAHIPKRRMQMQIYYPPEREIKKAPETQYLSWEGGTPRCVVEHRIRRRLLTLKPPSECGVYAWEKRGYVVSWEREKAEEEAAIALMQRNLEQVGIDVATGEIDIDLIMTGKPRSTQVQLQKVLNVITEMARTTGVVRDDDLFSALLKDYQISRADAAKLIGVLMRDGTIYSPRPGYFKRTV